jgi:hypothetical protein
MIIDGYLLQWKARVAWLNMAELRLDKYYSEGKINKQQNEKMKKIIDGFWLQIWDSYPRRDHSLEEAFHQNFSD